MSTLSGNCYVPHDERPAKPLPAVEIADPATDDDASDTSGAAMQVVVVDGADDAETLREHLPGATVLTLDVLSGSDDDEVESHIEDRNVLVLLPGDAGPSLLARAGDARARFGDVAYEAQVVSWPAWLGGRPFGFPHALETVGSRLAWMRSLPERSLPAIDTPADTRAADKPAVEVPPTDRWPRGLLVMATDRENFGYVVLDHGDRVAVEFTSPSGYKSTPVLPKSILIPQGVIPQYGSKATPVGTQSAPRPFSLDLIGSAAFFAEVYKLDWLAKGILVADQMGVIGGPSKSLKTSILIDLAISLASGSPFLGRFAIPDPVPVALISGESGRAVIQANAKRVCESKGVSYEAAGEVSWGFALPALTNAEHLAVLRKAIQDGGFKALMIDPLYMCLLAGNVEIDPKSMYAMGPVLDIVARTCLDEGCTPIVCHHFVKRREDPFGPATLEDLAFSGVGQFVRQWMLLSRRERYDPERGVHKFTFTYGGSAGHAGEVHLDVDTGQITEDLDHGRKWSVQVSTSSEGRAVREQQEREKREAKDATKVLLAEQRAEQALLANVGKIVEAIRGMTKGDQVATVGRIRDQANLNSEKARAAVARAETDGRIESYSAKVSNGKGEREVQAYRLVVTMGGRKS